MMMNNNSCAVCWEEDKTRMTSCPSCEKQVCGECFQAGMMAELREPQCLLCRAILPLEWIIETQPPEWIHDTFWSHWARWKMEMEKQRLPEDQEKAGFMREIKQLRNLIQELPTLKKIQKYPRRYGGEERLHEVRQQKKELRDRIHVLKQLYDEEDADNEETEESGERREREQEVVIIMGCPSEECRGYVGEKGSRLSCGLCKKKVCRDCGKIMDMETTVNENENNKHRCVSSDRDSFQMIRRETKPCPKCARPIYKASGCDQMWCVICHATFSWDTGEMINTSTNHVHNPHYYEWIQKMTDTQMIGRMIEEELNGGDIPTFHSYHLFLIQNPALSYRLFSLLHRNYHHLRAVILPLFHVEEETEEDRYKMRIQFLLGDLAEEKWQRRIMTCEKKHQKNKVFYQLIVENIQALGEYIRLSIIRPQDPPTMEEICLQLKKVSERIEIIRTCYKCSVHPTISLYLQRTEHSLLTLTF